MPKIILVNGPPRSGKDSLAAIFGELRQAKPIKFADPLRKAVPAMFGMAPDVYHDLIENHKETPTDLLMGMSPREAQIWLSEEVMKPRFGKYVFGLVAANAIQAAPYIDTWCFSDSGFTEEAEVIVEAFGAKNVALIKLEREGCTFAGDSRSYISLPGVTELTVPNNNSLAVLWERVSAWYDNVFIGKSS